jgi:hypothetical protein
MPRRGKGAPCRDECSRARGAGQSKTLPACAPAAGAAPSTCPAWQRPVGEVRGGDGRAAFPLGVPARQGHQLLHLPLGQVELGDRSAEQLRPRPVVRANDKRSADRRRAAGSSASPHRSRECVAHSSGRYRLRGCRPVRARFARPVLPGLRRRRASGCRPTPATWPRTTAAPGQAGPAPRSAHGLAARSLRPRAGRRAVPSSSSWASLRTPGART